eukprot:scaffold260406_cov18-Prasinocladus_malaysianus.AAC.3
MSPTCIANSTRRDMMIFCIIKVYELAAYSSSMTIDVGCIPMTRPNTKMQGLSPAAGRQPEVGLDPGELRHEEDVAVEKLVREVFLGGDEASEGQHEAHLGDEGRPLQAKTELRVGLVGLRDVLQHHHGRRQAVIRACRDIKCMDQWRGINCEYYRHSNAKQSQCYTAITV